MKGTQILIGMVAVAFSASAQAQTIVGSVHDLTTATGAAFSTTSNTDQVCVFCHTPHGSIAGGPLWNRQTPVGPYTMYSSATIDMTIAASPQGVSLACLSCHDGTVAFDVLVNAPTAVSGTYNYNAAGVDQVYTFTGTDSLAGRGFPTELSTNLSTEHPISVTYNPALDPDFKAAATVIAAGVPLYGGSSDQVECGSCHDPHDPTNVPFLRMSNAASALCTTCHSK